jgi:FkbM family methyltransferase
MSIYTILAKTINNGFRARRKIQGKLSPGGDVQGMLRLGLSELLGGERLSAVDVGGAVCLQPHWLKLRGNAAIYVFEPHPESYRELVAKYGSDPYASSFHVIPNALSGTGGKRILQLTNCPTGSSIVEFNDKAPCYHESNSYFFPMKKMEIETRTLRSILKEKQVALVDMIKIDVQGAELEILEGMGEEYIGSLLSIEAEIPMQNIYRNGTTLPAMMSFAQKHGFDLFDMRISRNYMQTDGKTDWHQRYFSLPEWHPSVSAKVWESEVVYFRSPLPLLERKDASTLHRLIASYCVYNFFTEATFLSEECATRKIFSRERTLSIQKGIRTMQSWTARDLAFYADRLAAFRNENWGQYLWLEYPTT